MAQAFEVQFSVLGELPKGGDLRWELRLHNREKASGDVRFLVDGVRQREFTARVEVSRDVVAQGSLDVRASCDGGDRHPACQP